MKKYLLLMCVLLTLLSNNVFSQNAEQIIERYLEVTGGKEKLRSVKSLKISRVGSNYTNEIEIVDELAYPNKKIRHLYTNGNETYHEEFNGLSGLLIQNNVETAMNFNQINYSKCASVFLPELYYQENNLTIQYVGERTIKRLNATYDKVQFTGPNGNYFTNYYDRATGHKARTEFMDTSFEHYSNFQEYQGMMIPYDYVLQYLLNKTEAAVTEVIINGAAETDVYAADSYNGARGDSDQENYVADEKADNRPPVNNTNIISAVNVKASDTYQRKLALVVGNAAYQNGGTLKNPVNDALAMSKQLKALGFEVLYRDNVTQGDMKKAIDEFGQKLKGYEVGLFYYAGHGIQYKGRNYMIPVEANLKAEQSIEYDCIAADRVLAYMEYAKSKVNIIVLDACRNNPFERSWQRSANGSGLAFMNAPSGSMIAYATSPGTTASDGSGSNGLYTAALLKYMNTPNLTIEQMFKKVRGEVEAKSGGKQTPWESTSLKGEFYFKVKN